MVNAADNAGGHARRNGIRGIFTGVYALVFLFPFWLGFATDDWFIAAVGTAILAGAAPFCFGMIRRKEERSAAGDFVHEMKNRLGHFSIVSGEIGMELEELKERCASDPVAQEKIAYLGKCVRSMLDNVKQTDEVIQQHRARHFPGNGR